MAVARVQHIYNSKSGLPRDNVVNTFYFRPVVDTTPLDAAAATLLADTVVKFYDDAAGAVRSFIAEGTMMAARRTLKVYDMADPEPRAPIITYSPTPAAANNSTTPLPGEVACCLSYRGALGSGLNAARRRGRIFVGPINTAALTQDANGNSRPSPSVQTALTANAKVMQDAAMVAGWRWVVWSQATVDSMSLDFGTTTVTLVWADNAWDTQRRRGVAPTSRTTLVVEPPG